jgi:hypothetical protein
MNARTREVRERELVGMLLFRRGAFHDEFRRVTGLAGSADISGFYDRDMLQIILDREFPSSDGSPRENDGPKCSDP